MFRGFAILIAAVPLWAGAPPAAVRAFLTARCTACHQGAKAPAGIDLTTLAFGLDEPQSFSTWVRVHDAVHSSRMPPQSKLMPAERAAFLRPLSESLRAHEQQRAAAQGRSTLRRLNRYEYENTLRDLLHAPWLQLKDMLPEDGILARFNKSGQALDVSHVQMARYMEASEQALRWVLASADEPEKTQRYYAREQKRMINRMKYSPFNRSPERATIPILGFEAQPDVIAEKAPMTVGESDPATRELEGFATPASTYVGNEYHFDQFAAPAGGRYKLRFLSYSLWLETVQDPATQKNRPRWWRPSRQRTSKGRTREPLTIYAYNKANEKRLLGTFDVTPEPIAHELDIYLQPGETILPDASRLVRTRPGWVGSADASAEGMPGVAYRWMEVTGPIAPAKTFRLPNTAEAVEPALREFLATAYRRAPRESEVARYKAIIDARRAGGLKEAVLSGYIAALCSPGFLYLEESPGALSGHALASRLSYFLWNAPPDDELRVLAANGLLRRPEVLRAQTERLLQSARSRDFLNAFLDYWLDLRRLGETTPDQILYPEYYLDDLLTESALKETQLFFAELVRRNLPASNLISSGFTMLNFHLAKHYGLPPVDGVAMRKVELPANHVRGGLLTQASVLKITANGTTTSPVVRGAWIMERILGDPPPPPPAGVPAVEPDTRGATTIRQQLDKHRSIPSCAACHNKIDPAGFALENFDIFGAWRDRYRSTEEGEPVKGIGKNGHAFTFRLSQPVDAAGQLETGEAFQNISELKRLLLADERKIARNMVQQWIAYSTGAPVSFGDRAEVERILDTASKGRYGLRSMLHEIVQSRLFRHK
ncbi:MAG: DUF1592 domain-containing protein [Bryobacterales bacterium]|nr:DUF1592 domain-containing protein [Bryobacterales bacterium]